VLLESGIVVASESGIVASRKKTFVYVLKLRKPFSFKSKSSPMLSTECRGLKSAETF